MQLCWGHKQGVVAGKMGGVGGEKKGGAHDLVRNGKRNKVIISD